jgi:hypothetical protein
LSAAAAVQRTFVCVVSRIRAALARSPETGHATRLIWIKLYRGSSAQFVVTLGAVVGRKRIRPLRQAWFDYSDLKLKQVGNSSRVEPNLVRVA